MAKPVMAAVRIIAPATAVLCAMMAQAQQVSVLGATRLDVAALQYGAEPTHCTGLVIDEEIVVTDPDCTVKARGMDARPLSIIPGLNGGANDGPGMSMPLPREFAVAHITGSNENLAFLQIGRIEGRGSFSVHSSLREGPSDPVAGDVVDVVHYAGEAGTVQVVSTCLFVGFGPDHGSLDCVLPDSARGAPVLFDGRPIGIISAPRDLGGAGFTRIRDADRPVPGEAISHPLPVEPFGSVSVLNLCGQDVHQGLFWIDRDGETWKEAARRIPAGSRVFLPVETIGDAIFSYARSDDGTWVWQGDDLTVRIRGADLPMRKLEMPRPTGDLTIIYDCE